MTMVAQSTSANSLLEARLHVVDLPDALAGLYELRQVADVANESESELLE